MVLLTLHARLGRWLQTGGHIESTDATLEAAAAREAHEESGLADLSLEPSPLLLSKHEVPCGTVRPTYHLDVQYLVLANHVISALSGTSRSTSAGLLMISCRRLITRSRHWYALRGDGLAGSEWLNSRRPVLVVRVGRPVVA